MCTKGKSIGKIASIQRKAVIADEDRLVMMDDLLHKLKSSYVSLEGYASVLSSEYAGSLDSKGKHYIKRIQGNMKEVDWVIRMLHECIKGMK